MNLLNANCWLKKSDKAFKGECSFLTGVSSSKFSCSMPLIFDFPTRSLIFSFKFSKNMSDVERPSRVHMSWRWTRAKIIKMSNYNLCTRCNLGKGTIRQLVEFIAKMKISSLKPPMSKANKHIASKIDFFSIR